MYSIAIGGIFIIGGLSGTMALRGTHSPSALAVVSVGLVSYGFIQMNSENAAQKQSSNLRRKTRVPGNTRRVVKSKTKVGKP